VVRPAPRQAGRWLWLNERRLALGHAQITTDLVTGNHREILTDFYERSVADLPEPMRTFVEDHLLTKSGFRHNLSLESALDHPGVARPLIDTLVNRRLLRFVGVVAEWPRVLVDELRRAETGSSGP
jgi:hypothetical protein